MAIILISVTDAQLYTGRDLPPLIRRAKEVSRAHKCYGASGEKYLRYDPLQILPASADFVVAGRLAGHPFSRKIEELLSASLSALFTVPTAVDPAGHLCGGICGNGFVPTWLFIRIPGWLRPSAA